MCLRGLNILIGVPCFELPVAPNLYMTIGPVFCTLPNVASQLIVSSDKRHCGIEFKTIIIFNSYPPPFVHQA